MNQNENSHHDLTPDEEFKRTHGGMDPESEYWVNRKGRRWRWDEWGSPVGLALGWAITIVSLGLFLYLLHLAGILH